MKRFLILFAVVAAGWLIAQTSDGFGPEELAVTAPVVASGGAWTPTNETVLAWWDATTIDQADDTDVSTWTSRNGIDLTAGTAPKFRTAIQNGNGVVSFSAGTKLLSTSATANSAKPFTIATVFHLFSTTTGTILGGTATGGVSLDVDSGSLRLLKQGVALIGSNPVVQDVWYATVVTYDGSGNYAFYTNAVNGLTGTSDQTFTGGNVRVGASASSTEALNGMIGDLIYDDAVWDATLRGQFFTWANTKWDIY